MNKSDSLKELAVALVAAQKVMKHATKDSENPFFKSKYADFASVWDACREALNNNGLAVSQLTGIEGTEIYVETMLLHTSGEWMSGKLTLTPVKRDPQSVGSAITYARRYALSGLCCLATEDDDDGNAATGNKAVATAKPTSSHPLAQKHAPVPLPAPPEGELTGLIEDVSVKSGEKNGIPWNIYSVKISGKYYSTFSDTDGANAQDWKGQKVYFTWKPSKNPQYKDLASIRRDFVPATAEYPATPNESFMFGTGEGGR